MYFDLVKFWSWLHFFWSFTTMMSNAPLFVRIMCILFPISWILYRIRRINWNLAGASEAWLRVIPTPSVRRQCQNQEMQVYGDAWGCGGRGDPFPSVAIDLHCLILPLTLKLDARCGYWLGNKIEAFVSWCYIFKRLEYFSFLQNEQKFHFDVSVSRF